MTGKRVGGIACLVVGVLFVFSGINAFRMSDGPALGDASGVGVSRAVGTFLPAVVVLIVGLWLLQKPAASKPAESDTPPDRRAP